MVGQLDIFDWMPDCIGPDPIVEEKKKVTKIKKPLPESLDEEEDEEEKAMRARVKAETKKALKQFKKELAEWLGNLERIKAECMEK